MHKDGIEDSLYRKISPNQAYFLWVLIIWGSVSRVTPSWETTNFSQASIDLGARGVVQGSLNVMNYLAFLTSTPQIQNPL